MAKHWWITIGGLVLAIACAVAWWAYKENQKRELERNTVALVGDSTERLREALGLLTAGAEARDKLEAHFTALESNVSETQALDTSIYPELVRAAEAYVTDVHALLRRELALHAGRNAVHAGIGAINNHLSAAGSRSPEWISQALALHQQLDSSYLDYRLAAGGLDKSLRSLHDTSLKLRTFVPATAVIEEGSISSAEQSLVDISTRVEQQVANAKKLPVN